MLTILVAILVLLTVFKIILSGTNFGTNLFGHLFANQTALASQEGVNGETFRRGDWEFVGLKNGVSTYLAEVPGTKLLAFRGVVTYSTHISEAMGLFCDLSLAPSWIDMLETINVYGDVTNITSNTVSTSPFAAIKTKKPSMWNKMARFLKPKNDPKLSYYGHEKMDVSKVGHKLVDIVHQTLKLPWPIAKRDIVLRRTWTFDHQPHNVSSVTILYKSVDDPRIPISPGIIRTISPHTLWRFSTVAVDRKQCHDQSCPTPKATQSKNEKTAPPIQHQSNSTSTMVEIECIVDSKGGIPSWFINFMQRSWPTKALGSYRTLMEKKIAAPFELVKHW